ncbi:MAG TPA: hypothetical protein VG370_07365 [Chloroflexota bacterium]|nr:hypothetical protein [Chloroflexota bacterium]
MPPLSVMFKTVSTDCNLDCAYCYDRESPAGTRVRRRIDPRLLETFIPQDMAYVADSRSASFAWQGGEPTLAGLSFFERVVALQAAHARPGTTIANALQTNGLLLDDDRGAFLKRYTLVARLDRGVPQRDSYARSTPQRRQRMTGPTTVRACSHRWPTTQQMRRAATSTHTPRRTRSLQPVGIASTAAVPGQQVADRRAGLLDVGPRRGGEELPYLHGEPLPRLAAERVHVPVVLEPG